MAEGDGKTKLTPGAPAVREEFTPVRIGKYVLLDKIASGGMADIFRAKVSGSGGFEKPIAIKKMLPHTVANEELKEMFRFEAKVCSALNHPNIIQVYDFAQVSKEHMLTMEYIEGKNLRQVLAKVEATKAKMTLDICAYLITEVLRGLNFAHGLTDEKGVSLKLIHRDMSPQNIMIDYQGGVKLIDFGIAKAITKTDQTKAGTIKGKFRYLSPEQAFGEPLDHRSDIFSVGIVLYEMVTMHRLFAADNDMNTLRQVQACKIVSPITYNPSMPFELERVILKALQKDREERYRSAEEFAHDLQKFLNNYNPTFNKTHLSQFIKELFARDIIEEKKRAQRQNSMVAKFVSALDGSDNSGGGHDDNENTHVELDENTQVQEIVEQSRIGGTRSLSAKTSKQGDVTQRSDPLKSNQNVKSIKSGSSSKKSAGSKNKKAARKEESNSLLGIVASVAIIAMAGYMGYSYFLAPSNGHSGKAATQSFAAKGKMTKPAKAKLSPGAPAGNGQSLSAASEAAKKPSETPTSDKNVAAPNNVAPKNSNPKKEAPKVNCAADPDNPECTDRVITNPE